MQSVRGPGEVPAGRTPTADRVACVGPGPAGPGSRLNPGRGTACQCLGPQWSASDPSNASRKEPGSDGPPQHEDPAARRFVRGEDPRHRRRGRDAWLLPRVRVLGHLLARPAGRPRRPQAGAPPDRVPDERDGPAPRPRLCEVRARRRRGHGQAAPARRRVDLRRPGAYGPALLHARAARRRPRQLRLAGQRRPAGRHAVHRVPPGRGDEPDDRVDRRGHGRLRAQLRRPGARAGGAARRVPEPAGQRLLRHRGRHGDEHAAAQPRRGHRGRPPPDPVPERGPGRADEARPGPGPAHRRPHRRSGRHPGRVRDGPWHLQDPCHGLDRDGDGPPQGPGDHRTALHGRSREGHREDQGPGQREEGPGHRRRQGPHRPRARPAPGHRDQERLRAGGDPGAAVQADADGGVLRHQQRRPGRRPAAHARPEGAAGGLPRPPLRRGPAAQRVPPRQEAGPAAPGRRSADRAGRHRRGHPADPVQRELRAGQGAPDGAVLAERRADAVHPRHAAAPAHQVRPHRAGGGEGQAHRGDRGADPDP